jgi:hypothetical protein
MQGESQVSMRGRLLSVSLAGGEESPGEGLWTLLVAESEALGILGGRARELCAGVVFGVLPVERYISRMLRLHDRMISR